MVLIIDAWNVLHQTGILPPESAGIGTRGLCKMISGSRWGRDTVTLVCDGTPSDVSPVGPRLRTVFTGPHRSADDEIMEMVDRSSAAKAILVVTSDREIIKFIKTKGARHLGSAAFLQLLVDDLRAPRSKKVQRPSSLSPDDAQEWKEQFGIDDYALQELNNTPIPELHLQEEPPSLQQETPDSAKKSDRKSVPVKPTLPPALLEEARRLLED